MLPRRLAEDRRGAVAVIVAVGGLMLAGATALAVDLGSVALVARRAQGAADLAALAAASDLTRAEAAARATVSANLDDALSVTTGTGRYSADPALDPGARFQSTTTLPDAARVTVAVPAPLTFGRWLLGKDSVTVTRTGTAARSKRAAVWIGTRLAALDGGAANALLTALTGSRVSLSVMDYRALASADVELFGLMDALKTDLRLTAADYDRLLDAEVTPAKVLTVLADRLQAEHQPGVTAARTLASAAATAPKLKLGRLLSLDGGATSGLEVRTSALDLASAVLQAANGDRQLALDLGARTGVADLDATLAIGDRGTTSPWLAVGPQGITVRTAQMRLLLDTKVGVPGLAQVRLPLYLEAARGEARVTDIDCASKAVSVGATPGLATLAVAQTTGGFEDFHTPLATQRVDILTLPLVKVGAYARTDLGGGHAQALRFSNADIAARTVRTVTTDDVARTGVASLFDDLDLRVQVLGLGLNLGQNAIVQLIGQTLAAAAPALDDVIGTLGALTGVRLGQADVAVPGLRCGRPALVG